MNLPAATRAKLITGMKPGDSVAAATGEGSALEQAFLRRWQGLGGPRLRREAMFHPTRKWRFDFSHWASQVAIELDGGVFSGGRHTRGKGFEGDAEKRNAATLMGWRVFHLTGAMLTREHLLPIIERCKEQEGEKR